MQNLFRELSRTVSAGNDAVLVTIVADSGSTPRGSGAGMLVTAKGRIAGTIGGGAVEFESIKLAQKCLENRGSTKEFYRLRKNEIADIGMICGGDVDIYFRYIPASDAYSIQLAEAVDGLFGRGEQSWLITRLDRDDSRAISVYSAKEGIIGTPVPGEVIAEAGSRPFQIETGTGTWYVESLVPAGRVFIFGGGHVSQQLVPIMSRCGFRCVVIEDRPEFTDPALFENSAAEILLRDMDNIAELVPGITSDDYICIMTRGHRDDYLVLSHMLKTPACYIGVIGSRHKTERVNAGLKAEGFSDSDLERITSPIGIDILSETPAEIAVSIAAQLIRVRAAQSGSRKIPKNLFLEGRPGCGKTSLLLRLLSDDLRQAGGFATARLRLSDGTEAGFRVKSASHMTAPDELYSDSLDNIFLDFLPGRKVRDEQAFVRFASKALKDSKDSPFIFMDEFGGIELTDPGFNSLLRTVVASRIPVTGVLKSRNNSVLLRERLGLGRGYSEAYEAFRKYIEETDSVIINVDEIGTLKAAAMITEWKKANLRSVPGIRQEK